jgi:hypothetical protein
MEVKSFDVENRSWPKSTFDNDIFIMIEKRYEIYNLIG